LASFGVDLYDVYRGDVPASKVLRLLKSPRQLKAMNRTFGGLFVAAGVLLATFKRA